MLNRMREERGIAMVVALLVSMVVLLLSTVVVAQSIHSLNGSGYDRKRLLSVNAAEAGVDAWWQYVQTTALTTPGFCNTKTATLGSSPVASTYSATATFYASDGATQMACPSLTDSNPPAYMRVVSTGTVASNTRKMESYGRLVAVRSGFSGAIISNTGTSSTNNLQINGDSGNDGDVYILNGDYSISTSPIIYGSVYVPNGTLSMSNNSSIQGNAWAYGDMSLTAVSGWAKSTTGNISGGSVGGSATALGTITSRVAGTSYPGTNPGPVPAQAFPQITSSTAPFTTNGYMPMSFTTCSAAVTYITSTWASGDLVVSVAGGSPCVLTTGNTTIALKGNLAIISDWGYNLSKTEWTATSDHNLYIITSYPASTACSSSNQGITMDNLTDFATTVHTLIYTPCTATIENKTQFSGQVIGGTVNIRNHYTQNYQPVLLPGYGKITSFNQDVEYKREIP